MLSPSAAIGPVQRKGTSDAKYFRLPITSITLRSGILAGLSAWALAEALPSALPKASSGPAPGDEEGEGLGVLGSGDTEGGEAVMLGSLDVCPTASRSGNTPTIQAAAATRERGADTAKRIVNPTRTPTMGSSPRRYERGHCSSAGGSSEGAFAVCQGYADERKRSVLKGARRRAATQIWPCGIFARGPLWRILSSGDAGTVALPGRRPGYRTDDNRDSWGKFGGRTRPGGVAPGCRVRHTAYRRSSREIAGAAPRRGQAPATRPYPECRVQGDSARGHGQRARHGESSGAHVVYEHQGSPCRRACLYTMALPAGRLDQEDRSRLAEGARSWKCSGAGWPLSTVLGSRLQASGF